MSGSEIELTWGCLDKTVQAGILPWDITVQVVNSKQLPTQAEREVRHRLILWDGTRTYKNALFSSDKQKVPDLYSVIRIGTDTVSDNTRESIINKLEKGEQMSYAYMFFNYILVKEGSHVNKKIYRTEQQPQENTNSASSPVCDGSAAPAQSTPPSGASHQPSSLHTPPNPPPLRRPNAVPRMSGSSSSAGPDTPQTTANRTISRESVKRNLVNSFPPEKRQNTGANAEIADKATHQIAAINPMMNRYSIKVRVSEKQGVREIASSRWQGKVNSCKLSDHSGDIMLKGFNAEAEKLDTELQNGFTYLISGAKVSPVRDVRYNSTNHSYELTWSQYTKVTGPFLNSAVTLAYKFTPIPSIMEKSEGECIDVCAWVKETGGVVEFRSRSDRDLKKRELVLVDNSTSDNNTISITLWNKVAEEFNSNNRVIAFKGAKVGEWNNTKNLSLGFTGSYEVEPVDVPEVQDLVEWAASQECSLSSQSLLNSSGQKEEFCTIQDLRTELLAHKGEKKCRLYGWITRIKHENMVYRAHTPLEGNRCQKKVLDVQGRLECTKCGKRNIPVEETTLRFSVRMSIADCTDTVWCSVFDAGEAVLNLSAEQINQLKISDEQDLQDHVSGCAMKSFIFHVIAKIETYNDTPQLKLIVNNAVDMGWNAAEPMNQSESADTSMAAEHAPWKDLARHMRDEIRAMEEQLGVSHTQVTSARWSQHINDL